MTPSIATLPPEESERSASSRDEAGFGALQTTRGILPLKSLDVAARVDGLLSLASIRQTFLNIWNEPLHEVSCSSAYQNFNIRSDRYLFH